MLCECHQQLLSGSQPCCTALWNEECFKGSCTHKDLLQEHTYAGSHHKNIGVSIYRNENWCKIWKLLFDVSCTTLANKPVTLNCSTTLNSMLKVIQPWDREICACAYPWHKSSSKADCRELFCYTDPGFPLLFLVPNTVFFVKSSSKDYMKLSEFCISLRGIFL